MNKFDKERVRITLLSTTIKQIDEMVEHFGNSRGEIINYAIYRLDNVEEMTAITREMLAKLTVHFYPLSRNEVTSLMAARLAKVEGILPPTTRTARKNIHKGAE